MSASQRRKGRSGEQELVRLLRERLGDGITRNLAQSRDGGCDLLGVGPFAIETKRCETLALPAWWRQACAQAAHVGLIPCLAYRQSRQPWKFVLPLGVLMGEPIDTQAIVTLGLSEFVTVVRMAAPEDGRAARASASTRQTAPIRNRIPSQHDTRRAAILADRMETLK